MGQHTNPSILRTVAATVNAVRPTCHLCSWTWDLKKATFRILRPSGACLDHRYLFGEPATSLLGPFTLAS